MKIKKSALFILSLTALLHTSCQKIEEKPPELGEPVSVKAIQDELSKLDGQIDPTAAKVGDKLSLLMNVMVENTANLQTLGLMTREVTERTQSSSGVEYKIRNIDYEVQDNTTTEVRNEICTMTISTEGSYTCPSDTPTTPTQKILMKHLDQAVQEKTKKSDQPNPVIDRRYFSLKTTPEAATPPEVVRNRPNCSGLNPCKINLHHIQYDELIRFQDGTSRRLRWNYAMTADLPYLGTEGIQYQTCVSESVNYQGRPILLKQCIFVYDLIKTP